MKELLMIQGRNDRVKQVKQTYNFGRLISLLHPWGYKMLTLHKEAVGFFFFQF